jgi:para-aminobenzoate synthetase component 1
MEIIDELEPVTRSVYTGVIGCIQPDAGLDFSIAIRTIIKKKRRLYLPVGSGIVYDSKQTAEFRETLDKAKSFMKILR